MIAKKTPLQQVNEDHGGKSKLVDALLGLIDHGDEEKDAVKARLLKASNKKLLRLRASTVAIKEKYGSVEKLVTTVADKLGRAKDKDFVSRLAALTPGRLLDLARSLAGEARRPLKTGTVVVKRKAAPVKKKAVVKKGTPAKKGAAARKGVVANKKGASAKKAAAKKAGKK